MTDRVSERKKLIEKNLLSFLESLDFETVSDYLQAKQVLPEFVIEKIAAAAFKPSSARRTLINAVKARIENGFDEFYLALHYAKQDNLAILIKEGVSDNIIQTIENQPNSSTTSRASKSVQQTPQEKTPDRLNQSISSLKVSSSPSRPSSSSWLNEEMVLKGFLDNLSVTEVDGPNHEEILKHYEENKNTIYSNFGTPKGLCLVINNRKFFDASRTRNGTEIDEKNLQNLFNQLGYTVIVKADLRGKEILSTVHDFGKDLRHRKGSSCIICILSHGEEDVILGTDDGTVNIQQLLSMLNSHNAPMLTGKPKLVFIQACRGGNYDRGISTTETDCGPVAVTDEMDMFGFNKMNPFACVMKQMPSPEKIQRIPIEADFLVAYATTPNYVSYRNTMLGSWFVQAICEVFSKEACRRPILELMTLVNQRVSASFQTRESRKQMPEVCSRLRKQFHFYPGIERSSSV